MGEFCRPRNTDLPPDGYPPPEIPTYPPDPPPKIAYDITPVSG